MDFYPLEGLGKFDLQMHGSLAVFLGQNEARIAKSPASSGGASGVPTRCEVDLGAGVGFEPTTFRL